MSDKDQSINFKPIGIIRTPYTKKAPYQPIKKDKGEFKLVLDSKYQEGLDGLDKFRFIFVIYHLNRVEEEQKSMKIVPPWMDEPVEVGVFASRAPNRPNPIGLSIVEIIKIERNIVYTSGLDVFDNTPLLDIKPYIKDLDQKYKPNYGWIQMNDQKDREHLLKHIRGEPH